MRRVIFCLALMCGASAARADVVLNFDSLPEFTAVTNQFAGLVFSDATVLSAGSGLNEIDFPPHSGTNVVFDDSGPMSISFLSPVDAFAGYFTYAESLTLEAFDASHNLLDVVHSAFSNNTGTAGDPQSSPDEFLSVSSPSLIAQVVITGDPLGGSFTLDDATISAPASSVSEPAYSGLLWMVAAGLLPLFGRRKLLPFAGNGREGGLR
ncbi:MAG TPA: hypothetical protein VKT49_12500 [Bryobacteraceae bacterium]|nr:hypothetical protein [Bryobacteraceae bacterium]